MIPPLERGPSPAQREVDRLSLALPRSLGADAAAARGLVARLAELAVRVDLLVLSPVAQACAHSPRWPAGWRWMVERLMRRGVIVTALVVLAVAVALWSLTGWWPLLVGALPAGLVAAAAAGRYAYPLSTRGRVRGRHDPAGFATWWDLRRHVSAHAVREGAVATRPSVRDSVTGTRTRATSARATARLPVTECGTWLGDTAVGPWRPVPAYAALRDVVGLIGPPQTFKSALMGHHIIDHPGAVVSTSTKLDQYEHTAALRARRSHSGRVELFNPKRLGNLASTFRFSPVTGCQDPMVAAELAGAMVGATSAAGGEDGTFWLDSSAKVLRCLLMAAALEGLSMVTVTSWVTNPGEASEAWRILRRRGDRVPAGWADELQQILGTEAKRTRESIFLTLSQSVAFMADPEVAAICQPDEHDPEFDVARFVDDLGTLYVVATDRPHAAIAPLVAALTTRIFESAKRLAAARPMGRLDPPLRFVLDEAPLTAKVDLPRWVADSGGSGIPIEWAAQSPSQLAERWGERGKDTIWNATNATLIGGGIKVESDLEAISRLCGEVETLTNQPTGGARSQLRRVLDVNDVRELEQWHQILVYRAMPVTIVTSRPVWERDDVRMAGPPPEVAPIRDVLRDEVVLDLEDQDGVAVPPARIGATP